MLCTLKRLSRVKILAFDIRTQDGIRILLARAIHWKKIMWWQTIITLSLFCVCISNAVTINGTEFVLKPVSKPKTIDDICFTPECIHAASWILTNSKFSVDPCDDFYEFTCGNVDLTSIPDDHYTSNEINLVDDKLFVRLRSLIESIDKAKVPKHFGLLKTLYDNCMSAVKGNIYSDTQFANFYDQLHATDGWPVLVGNKWNETQFSNKPDHLAELLSITLNVDPENSTYNVPHLSEEENELGYDILRLDFNNDIVQAYYALMVDIAVSLGATRQQAESELKEALLLGIDIAKSTQSAAKQLITTKRWNQTTVGAFVKKHSKLNFRSFIFESTPASYNLTDNDVIIVHGDFDKFEEVLSNAPKRALANWLAWMNLEPYLPTLHPTLHARNERFNNFGVGNMEKSSRWKECVTTVRSELGLSLSALYQRTYMSQKIVSDLTAMVRNIKRQLHELVTQADWLDTKAKEEYLQKIVNMISQVSYRNEYVDDKKLEGFYKKVELTEGRLADSLHNISIGTSSATLHSWRNPNVRDNWIESGNILEGLADYLHFSNLLRVGASITLKNFYHIDRPKYINYGTSGFAIAHEMGHTLDTLGIHIDKQRNVREWWSPETKRKFDDRVQCLVNQYGNYTVEELSVKLNGPRLAAENIADNIGTKVAYQAYLHWASQNGEEKELAGLSYTPKQMFWISMSSLGCTKFQMASLRNWVAQESHTPDKQRVNGIFANIPEFADDFKCKPGTKMNPVQKCSVL